MESIQATTRRPASYLWMLQLAVVFVAIYMWCVGRLPFGWGLGVAYCAILGICYLQIPIWICITINYVVSMCVGVISVRRMALIDAVYISLGPAHALLVCAAECRRNGYVLFAFGFINFLYIAGATLEARSRIILAMALLGFFTLNIICAVMITSVLAL